MSVSALLFVLHVALNFRTAIFIKGALESRPAAIALAYARSRALWIDLAVVGAVVGAAWGHAGAAFALLLATRNVLVFSESSRRRQRWSRARCGWV